MGNFERTIIQVSIEDVIRILEDAPARGHFIPYITIAEVLNRVAIAHLSIEKAIKFLILEKEKEFAKDHHLGNQFRKLKKYAPEPAAFLEDVFKSSILHYGINDKSQGMTHFRRLDAYLDTTGSGDVLKKVIRYWELEPSLDSTLLRQVHLSIHMELLYGLHEILIEPGREWDTVEARVEKAVETAMFPNGGMTYCLATANERSAKMYRDWLNQFGTLREALADAVKRDFILGNELTAKTARSAYKALLDAKDPAVLHFARALDILPPQPRDVVPDVEWLDGNRRQKGRVSTPSGVDLGIIERGPHGRWYITPNQVGPIGEPAKAETQKDAICYLAQLLSRPARVACDGVVSSLRIIGKDRNVFKETRKNCRNPDQDTLDDETKKYRVEFWEENHGIEVRKEIVVESERSESQGLTLTDILSGEVQEVIGHQIIVTGRAVPRIGLP